VQRHQPRAAELRLPDRDHAGGQVDILSLKRDRLADPHARDGEQTEQRLVGRCPQQRAQRSGRPEQSADLLL
jgi:hypothetical protein